MSELEEGGEEMSITSPTQGQEKKKGRKRKTNDLAFLTDPYAKGAEISRTQKAFPGAVDTPLPLSPTPTPTQGEKKGALKEAVKVVQKLQTPALEIMKEKLSGIKEGGKGKAKVEAKAKTEEELLSESKILQKEIEKLKEKMAKADEENANMRDVIKASLLEELKKKDEEEGESEEEEEYYGSDSDRKEGEDDLDYESSSSEAPTLKKTKQSKKSRSQSRPKRSREDDEEEERRWKRKQKDLPSLSEEEREMTPPLLQEQESEEPNREVLETVRRIAEDYWERGSRIVKGHQLFREPSYEEMKSAVLAALGRNEKGNREYHTRFKTKIEKYINAVQEMITRCEDTEKKALTVDFLREYFGVQRDVECLSLFERVNLIGILASDAMWSVQQMEEELKKRKKVVRVTQSPTPWATQSIQDFSGSDLQMLHMEDIARCPVKWRDFILSSENHGANRRELMAALSKRYLFPLQAKKGDRVAMQQVWEIKEDLWEVEMLLTLPPDAKTWPRSVFETHDLIFLHKMERMETLKLFVKDPRTAVEFQRLVRMEPPRKSKDLRKIQIQAEKSSKKEEKSVRIKDIASIAHFSQSIARRPGPAISRSVSSPPHQGPPFPPSSQRPVFRGSSTPTSPQFFHRGQFAGRGPPRQRT